MNLYLPGAPPLQIKMVMGVQSSERLGGVVELTTQEKTHAGVAQLRITRRGVHLPWVNPIPKSLYT